MHDEGWLLESTRGRHLYLQASKGLVVSIRGTASIPVLATCACTSIGFCRTKTMRAMSCVSAMGLSFPAVKELRMCSVQITASQETRAFSFEHT
eukprot:1157708-Pelagomonas_calceolata.AAC.6